MQTKRNVTYSFYMVTSNLVELIELLSELEDIKPDPRLKDGEVLAADGTIIVL